MMMMMMRGTHHDNARRGKGDENRDAANDKNPIWKNLHAQLLNEWPKNIRQYGKTCPSDRAPSPPASFIISENSLGF